MRPSQEGGEKKKLWEGGRADRRCLLTLDSVRCSAASSPACSAPRRRRRLRPLRLPAGAHLTSATLPAGAASRRSILPLSPRCPFGTLVRAGPDHGSNVPGARADAACAAPAELFVREIRSAARARRLHAQGQGSRCSQYARQGSAGRCPCATSVAHAAAVAGGAGLLPAAESGRPLRARRHDRPQLHSPEDATGDAACLPLMHRRDALRGDDHRGERQGRVLSGAGVYSRAGGLRAARGSSHLHLSKLRVLRKDRLAAGAQPLEEGDAAAAAAALEPNAGLGGRDPAHQDKVLDAAPQRRLRPRLLLRLRAAAEPQVPSSQ